MRKKIFLLFLLLLLTGCEAKYEIEIYDEEITENVVYYYTSNELNNKDPYEYTEELNFKYFMNKDMLRHEHKKGVSKKNMKGVSLINTYKNMEEYNQESMMLGACYIAQNATYYEDYITLKTSNEFTCYNEIEELDSMTIAIKSNHKLKETNADKIKGHTYYWYINKDNYKEKPISLVLYSDKYVWNYNNEILKRLLLIIFIIGGTVLVATNVYKVYKKKENL